MKLARTLSAATDASVASAAGSIIGGITGIPGLGQVASLIGSLFGPSPHFTPSGVPYDTQDKTCKELIVQVASLANQLHAREGLPPIPVPAWAMNSSDDALLAKWMGALLSDPSVASAQSEDDVIHDQAAGIMDEAVSAAQQLIQQLQSELSQPNSTVLPQVLPSSPMANAPLSADYESTVGGAPPLPSSYDATQQQVTPQSAPAPQSTAAPAPSTPFGPYLPYIAVGAGALLLAALLGS